MDSYVVKRNERVKAGQLIGYAGYTGYVVPAGINGKHLHFEVRYKAIRRNPLVWLDNDFTPANTRVYLFAAGERSAIRGTAQAAKKTVTLKDGTWNIRKGPSTTYVSAGTIKSPTNGVPTTLEYTDISNGWYHIKQGYIGPAAIKSST